MTRKAIAIILSVLLAFQCVVMTVSADDSETVWREFYVSASGSDSNDGSKAAPFKTVEKARDAVRKINSEMKGDIIVNILADGGVFKLSEVITFTPEDSGKNGYRVIYRGKKDANGEMPVLSGGVKITGFAETKDNPEIWAADVLDDDIDQMRQLYVNGNKAYMARTDHMVTGNGYYTEPGSRYNSLGMYMSKEDIGIYENAEDMEVQWNNVWKFCSCAIESIEQDPSNENQVIVKMRADDWSDRAHRPASGLDVSPEKPFIIVNAMELLDAPGEFYFNRKTRKVYYMPHEDEDMNTAEVYAPNINRLLDLRGYGPNDKIENISFEGIEFAHTSVNAMSEGLETGQASLCKTIGLSNYLRGAITLNMAKGVAFEGNHLFGLGENGIDLENGCEEILINGNAMSDIGGSAIHSGREYQRWGKVPEGLEEAPESYPSELNLTNGTAPTWSSSRNAVDTLRDHAKWIDRSEGKFMNTWVSNPEDAENGKKSWVMYDFNRPYNITSIRLGFKSEIEDSARSGYEVLLSNDIQFREGNYVVLATQETPADDFVEYKVESEEEYRYVMVRTLGATQLKLSGVWVFTDFPQASMLIQRNKNNTFSNNYIRRAASEHTSSIGIMMYYTEKEKVVHNELEELPYSGISSGWGWGSDPEADWDNYFGYNRVTRSNLTLQDGGSLYFLAFQRGTTIERNWFDATFVGKASHYVDETTSYLTYRDNVVTNSGRYLMQYYGKERGSRGNNFYRFIADNSSVEYVSSPLLEPTEIITITKLSEDAYTIMEASGLEKKYRYLKDLVSDKPMHLTQQDYRLYNNMVGVDSLNLDYFKKGIQETAENIIALAEFGDFPGQIPLMHKYQIKDTLDAYMSMGGAAQGYKMQQLREANIAARDAIYEVNVEEMLQIMKTALSEASTEKVLGGYPKAAYNTFKKEFEAIEKEVKSGKAFSEFKMLEKMKASYKAFENARYTTDVSYIYTQGMSSCRVDKENKTVTLEFPYGTDLSKARALDITTPAKSEVGLDVSAVSFERDLKLPIYCAELDEYTIWTVRAIYEGAELKENTWVTTSQDPNSLVEYHDGTYLPPRRAAHMNTEAYTGGVREIKFIPKTPNDISKISIILAAASANDMTLDDINENTNRLEVVFDGKGEATLYDVVNGSKKSIYKTKADLVLNAENKLTYRLGKEGDLTRIEIYLNGEGIFNVLTKTDRISGFEGFFSEKIGLLITE